MSVEVQVQRGDGGALPAEAEGVERAVRHALAAEGVDEAELSLTLLDDDAISRMNRDYLSHEGPTDVISFPLRTPDGAPVGDIYIGLDQARRQAGEAGVGLAEELLRLAIHGTLHVLGYEHPDDPDERAESQMYRRQERLLSEVLGA